MTRSFFWKAKPLHWEKLTRLNTFIWSLPPWMITGLSEQKWACVKNPRNTSPFQHDRKTGTIKQISSTITNCDLKMAPADLRCFIAQNTADLRSHQRLPSVFWQLPDECRWTLNDFSLTPRRQGGLIQISIVSILKGDLWKRKKGCLKEMKAGELFKWKQDHRSQHVCMGSGKFYTFKYS